VSEIVKNFEGTRSAVQSGRGVKDVPQVALMLEVEL